MNHFEKIKKKYALNNSYFKNRRYLDPATPLEVMEYFKQHNELPFQYSGDNWVYDCYVEYQKRAGVHNSQFFTPVATAQRIADLANEWLENEPRVLDACCGFGQLANPLVEKGFIVHGFDVSKEMVEMYRYNTSCICHQSHFNEFTEEYLNVVANPPYEVNELTEFLIWLHGFMKERSTAILLVPFGFFDKERPKALIEVLSKFHVRYREEMTEDFARTKTHAEIVTIQK